MITLLGKFVGKIGVLTVYDIGEEEREALERVLASRQFFRYRGEGNLGECDLFEKEFADFLGVSHSILLTSGTNALIAALEALEIGEGDEVLIPAHTFVATASSVLAVRAIPVVVNIDETLTIDPRELRKKVSPQTKAIIPVHIDGLICDMSSILEIAKEHNLYVIEDACQAIGGSFKGQRVGSFGDFGCFSLNMDKIISTGEGGVLCTKDRTLYERAFCVHDSASQYGPSRRNEYQNIVTFSGRSMRVSEFTGAMARTQLKKLDPILEKLRVRKDIILRELMDVEATLVRGHCKDGDCAVSVHLTLNSPEKMAASVKKLLSLKIPAVPIQTRLAHFCWQWSNILYNEQSSPYSKRPFPDPEGKQYTFRKFSYLPTIDIVSRTMRMNIDFRLSLEETESLAKLIKNTIRDV